MQGIVPVSLVVHVHQPRLCAPARMKLHPCAELVAVTDQGDELEQRTGLHDVDDLPAARVAEGAHPAVASRPLPELYVRRALVVEVEIEVRRAQKAEAGEDSEDPLLSIMTDVSK